MYLFKLNIVRIKLAAVLQSTDSKMYAKSWLNSIQMWQIAFDFLTCFTSENTIRGFYSCIKR